METDKTVNACFHLYASGQRAQRTNITYAIFVQVSSNITETTAVFVPTATVESHFYLDLVNIGSLVILN